MPESFDQRLLTLGLTLPSSVAPIANYVPAVITGNLLYISGQGAMGEDGQWLTGRVPDAVSSEEAYRRARLTGLRILAVVKQTLGTLDQVQRIVKIVGFVNCAPEYGNQPAIINGCSDLMVEVFGDRGRHARSALGVTGLPANLSVEIEAVVEIGGR